MTGTRPRARHGGGRHAEQRAARGRRPCVTSLRSALRPASRSVIAICLTASLLAAGAHARDLTVAFPEQPDLSAKAQMLEHIVELNTDIEVALEPTTVQDMWAGLADGRYDASAGVLLPRQEEWLARYGASVEDLGPNWIGPAFSIHTVVRKGYAAENLPVVRLLNNYCRCGERLAAVIGLNEDGRITAGEAAAWMRANEAWVANMMGFAREYDDREDRYVTY